MKSANFLHLICKLQFCSSARFLKGHVHIASKKDNNNKTSKQPFSKVSFFTMDVILCC